MPLGDGCRSVRHLWHTAATNDQTLSCPRARHRFGVRATLVAHRRTEEMTQTCLVRVPVISLAPQLAGLPGREAPAERDGAAGSDRVGAGRCGTKEMRDPAHSTSTSSLWWAGGRAAPQR